MAELTPLYMDISGVYSGDELGLPYRDIMGEGVVGSGDLAVTQHAGGANLSVDVAAGAAWVLGDTNTDAQPCYRVRNDAVVNKGITPDPSNPRKVIIVAQITDATFAGATRQWAIAAIHGTPAASPSEPALPASALKLAVITVPAAATTIVTANIADARVRAVVGGGQAVVGGPVTYRKVTPKQIVNTVAETDILNGEIVLPASVMGTDRAVRLTAWGDWKQNSGVASSPPRLKLKLGATTLIDTNALAAVVVNDPVRYGWRITAEIQNLGAANSQWATLSALMAADLSANASAVFTTGEGVNAAISAAAAVQAIGGNAGAVDTTVVNVLALTAILGGASASYDVTLKGALVEVI